MGVMPLLPQRVAQQDWYILKFDTALCHRSAVMFSVSEGTLRNLIPLVILNDLPILSFSLKVLSLKYSARATGTAKSL